MYWTDAEIEDLHGKVLTNIEKQGDRKLMFLIKGGETFEMFHKDDCCETVKVEDICGDLEDLLHSPILLAEKVSGKLEKPLHATDESYTWTFYKLATLKGFVTIRWYGESNGHYSEKVDFVKQNRECGE
ncbi:DUF7448 domain-containing protein [Bacillus thuringiensis]|uniref:DUF7448 domain-containing protein n=1 Tax=Bacillus thuringiensis TaxID=1428 RepID=UPI000BFD34CA|nr:hypothetical protein [Bacillus thuringiensis]PGT89791.1 hypothetical protein COD17_08555 [Bacillus thuringiensis]